MTRNAEIAKQILSGQSMARVALLHKVSSQRVFQIFWATVNSALRNLPEISKQLHGSRGSGRINFRIVLANSGTIWKEIEKIEEEQWS